MQHRSGQTDKPEVATPDALLLTAHGPIAVVVASYNQGHAPAPNHAAISNVGGVGGAGNAHI